MYENKIFLCIIGIYGYRGSDDVKRIRNHLNQYFYLDFLVLFFLLISFFIDPVISAINGAGFVMNPVEQVFKGYYEIIKSPSILVTDYVYIAGLGATFFNVSTILLINLILIKLLKIKMNGPIFAGVIMICGFSFFGKNIFNTFPIYFGIYLFARYKKIPYRSFIISLLFSTGISPLVSYAIFGFGLAYYISIPLGIVCGILAGIIIPAFASHTIIFHEGYNLYNTGFALGIISVFFNGLFRLCGLEVASASLYDYSSSQEFYYLLPILSLSAILFALIKNKKCMLNYWDLMKTSGRLISDYATDYDFETVLYNFGMLGLVLFFICVIFRVPMNGVVFGSILSILGFAGYGLHLKNVTPIWIGAGVMIYISMLVKQDMTLTISSIMMFVFASGLAPISGRYGFIYGLLAGAMHIIMTPLMLSFQGGFDLYNNGFSAGFVAAIITVLADKVVRRDRNGRKRKNQ